MQGRTDLAMEAEALWNRSARAQTALSGVRAREETRDGFTMTTIEILSEKGAKTLKKPRGKYVTVALSPLVGHERDAFSRAAALLAEKLRAFLPEGKRTLVVGLGNERVTPDAVGPLALRHLLVTRHLPREEGSALCALREVSAVQTGVLGTTGIESAEIVRGIVGRIRPEQLIVIDALASNEPSRLCAAVQLTEAGIVPGSGVGNSRAAFDRESMGVPVLAVGVPTVMEASALANEALSGDLTKVLGGMLLMPRDIDARVREIGRLIGYSLDLSLHGGLLLEDLPSFFA